MEGDSKRVASMRSDDVLIGNVDRPGKPKLG